MRLFILLTMLTKLALCILAMRYSTSEEYKDDCTSLIHSLGNIRYKSINFKWYIVDLLWAMHYRAILSHLIWKCWTNIHLDGYLIREYSTCHTVQVWIFRAVINHFRPKVDSWAKVNHLSSLTEDQVLEVVKSNYDTLTLKLHDSLDQFDRYSEKPETNFFLNMVSSRSW